MSVVPSIAEVDVSASPARPSHQMISVAKSKIAIPEWCLACTGRITSSIGWVFGLLSMIVGLSLIATIPIIQFISLGYLLAISAMVAKTGRVRDGLLHVRQWGEVGIRVLAIWLLLLPLRAILGLRNSAILLDHPLKASQLGFAFLISVTLIMCHIAWALLRGGRLQHFVWPAPLRFARSVRNQFSRQASQHVPERETLVRLVAGARDRFFEWIRSLNVGKHFVTGLKGSIVAMSWLAVPVTLMFVSTKLPEEIGFLVSVVAGLLLATVLLYLPFLQINSAVDDNNSSKNL